MSVTQSATICNQRIAEMCRRALGDYFVLYLCGGVREDSAPAVWEVVMLRGIGALAFVCVASLSIATVALGQPVAAPPPVYFPERNNWVHKTPEEEGMDSARLDQAVQAAIADENPLTRNMVEYLATTFGAHEPMSAPIGPVKDRGPANGIITRHGYIVAEWGDPKRIDMTFSVSKTFLTTVVGLAWQRGLIKDVNDFARDYMPAGVDLF